MKTNGFFKRTRNQIVVAIGTIATIFFGFYAILEIDDRWNQAYGVEKNCSEIDKVRKEVIDIAGGISIEMSLRFEEQRRQDLQDQLLKLKIDRSKNPEDTDIRDWIEDTRKELDRTNERIEELKKSQAKYNEISG